MSVSTTSIRLETRLAGEAKKILGAKIPDRSGPRGFPGDVALKRFKALMKKNAGKLSFAGHTERLRP